MADDKTTHGWNQDRGRVAGGQEYEVDYFARKHGITAEQAQQLIKEYGNSREILDAEAEKLKKRLKAASVAAPYASAPHTEGKMMEQAEAAIPKTKAADARQRRGDGSEAGLRRGVLQRQRQAQG
jgi:hypothetical protein